MDNLNGIHIIDCSDISEKPLAEIQNTREFKNFSEKFGNGMKLNGIVYLINAGVDEHAISNFEEKLEEFYSLPFETKKKYESSVFEEKLNYWGRWGWDGPTAKVQTAIEDTESFHFTSHPQFEDDSLYPNEVNGFKDALLTFRKTTRCLSNKLLRGLGEYLKLEDKDFLIHKHHALEEDYGKSKFTVRTMYYRQQPEIPKDASEFRLVEHYDLGTLTHLCQNSHGGGFQAKLHTGEWVNVEYIPNSFIMHAGRSLEMWSGGNIPAVLHRVVWSEKSKTGSRISFGCFLSPDRDACCLPLVDENPNWTTRYTKMQPGEIFDDYFKREIRLLRSDAARLKKGN